MTNQHPITPPPELVVEWADTIYQQTECDDQRDLYVATQAARWGYQQCMKLDAAWLEAKLQKARDQELEACCEWAATRRRGLDADLRAARRPKPLSLKEQALEWCNDYIDPDGVIRRALEQLDD